MCAVGSETHGRWCTVQDMMHEVGAEPLDHRTTSAGLETGEACQSTSHSPQLPGAGGGGGAVERDTARGNERQQNSEGLGGSFRKCNAVGRAERDGVGKEAGPQGKCKWERGGPALRSNRGRLHRS